MRIRLPKLPPKLRPYKFIVLLIPLFMILNYRGDEKYVSSTRVFGHWQGTGRFMNSKLHSEAGYMDIDLMVNEDFSATGNVGDAVISEARLCRHIRVFEKDGNILHCTLQGELVKGKGLNKDNFSIQLYLTSPDQIGFTKFSYGRYAGRANLKRVE